MIDLGTVRTVLDYTDWSNRKLLECAAPLSDEQLDRDMQIGPGTMRRTMRHIYAGEFVWLRRWRGETETTWIDEGVKLSVEQLAADFEANIRERDTFLARLFDAELARVQRYRDSKGNLFDAPLGEMLMQGVMHSKHHQAQAVNILRRVGAAWPELDYMVRIRRADGG